MECFCGCGRSVPRFPLGLRSVNKRGARHAADVSKIQRLLDAGMRSPTAEAYVADGEEIMERIALAVHGRTDPGPEVETASRAFLSRTRAKFTDTALGKAARRSGLDESNALDLITRGEFDPFA
jgi:hypothetical protein